MKKGNLVFYPPTLKIIRRTEEIMDVITSVHQGEALFCSGQGARTKGLPLSRPWDFSHEGGISASWREGKKRGDILIVSIFVNPPSLDLLEDFERYPRNFAGTRPDGRGAV